MATIQTFYSGTLHPGTTTSPNYTIPTGVTQLEIDFSMLQTDADSPNTNITFQLIRNDNGVEEVGFGYSGGPNQGDGGSQTPNVLVMTTDIGSLQGVTVHAVITSATQLKSMSAQIKLS